MSSGLFKTASSYCISLVDVFSNAIFRACFMKKYFGCFFNIFIVFESQKVGEKASFTRKGFLKERFEKKCHEAKRPFKTIARFQNFGLYHDKKRSGKPKITSSRNDNLIRRIAVWSPISSCKKIRSALLLKGTDVHRTTVSRRLVHDFNLKTFNPAKNLA